MNKQAREILKRNSIKTTLVKAKAAQPVIERIITKAKKGGEANRRLVNRVIADKKLVKELFEKAKERFAARSSGYTRIVRLGIRAGDASEKVQLSFVDEPKKYDKTDKSKRNK